MIDGLIQSKLSPPHMQREAEVPRRALLKSLASHRQEKLILLCAAAGYGKSTLMSQYYESLDTQGGRVAWCSLDEDDADPERLFACCFKALSGGETWKAENLVEDLKVQAATLAQLLLRTGSPDVFFLDEFELLQGAASQQLIFLLLQQLPANKQLVISSRQRPDWSLAKLRMRGEIFELSEQELKLDSAEVRALSERKLSHGLDERSAQQLVKKTEGWIGGVCLAMLCYPQTADYQQWVGGISGALNEISDFLAEEVFIHLTQPEQAFLLDVAVAKRLNGALCEALTGSREAHRLLHSFYAKGVFMQSLDNQGEWFRLHGLMRQFLLKKLSQTEVGKIPKQHVLAARWFESADLKMEALQHAIKARDGDFSIATLRDLSQDLVNHGQLSTLSTLAAKIAKYRDINDPELMLNLCWAHFLMHERHLAVELFQQLNRMKEESAPFAQGIAGQLLAMQSLLLVIEDEIPRAGKLAQESLLQLGESDHFERGVLSNISAYALLASNQFELSGHYRLKAKAAHTKKYSGFGIAYADMMAGLSERLQGRLVSARACYQQIGKGARSLGESVECSLDIAKSVTNGFEVELLYELRSLDEAEALLEQYLPKASTSPIPDMVIALHLTRARLAFARGEVADAYAFLQEGELAGFDWPLPRLVQDMGWERVRFALQEGDLAKAQRYAMTLEAANSRVEDAGYVPLVDGGNTQDIPMLRLQIYSQDAAKALDSIDALLVEDACRPGRRLKLLLLQVIALNLLKQESEAQEKFVVAMSLAQQMGAVSSVIDEGEIIVKHLKLYHGALKGARQESMRSYCSRLLAALGVRVEEGSMPLRLEVEGLSEREVEILQLVGGGMKNTQIAEHLCLSINTIKWHLSKAYTKLGVSSRTSALAEARRLALVD